MCIYIHICFWGFFSQILFPCCCSVTQLCPTLREPMDCSTPGFPVLHYLPEFFQTHVHWVNDTNHLILCHPLLLLPSIFPASGSFPISQFFPPGGHSIGALASASVFPMNIQSWFLLWLTGFFFFLFAVQGTPKSLSTVWKHQFFITQPLWSKSHIHIWLLENHSFNSTDHCWQSDVSAF